MLLPIEKNKNKRGLSMIIGYVLLIVISIVMSVIVYQWMKNYVPKEILKCPDGTSLFIKEAVCTINTGILNLTFKNNGRFGIDGYFIHGSTDSTTLATIDLSANFSGSEAEKAEKILGNSIRFSSTDNSLSPEETLNVQTHSFNVSTNLKNTLSKVEIIPIRVQTQDNIRKIVSCGDAKIETTIICD